ncbi:hypothetical protein RIEGSTA812A_PEG_1268 [invertebrate metagenome]|uniref:Uncharacterized protein n=1 Tax=invertebrate metagenome TaxID=1711999 RepID=A0A484H8B2_9ZZZZ
MRNHHHTGRHVGNSHNDLPGSLASHGRRAPSPFMVRG